MLDHLARDLIGNLVTPVIDSWHIYIVHKHRHFLAARRTVSAAHSLVHVALDGALEHERCAGRRKVEGLEKVRLGVVLVAEALDHDSLGCALLTDQEDGLLLLGDRFDQVVGSNVVDVGHENGGVLWHRVLWIVVAGDAAVPVLPLAILADQILKDGLLALDLGQVEQPLLKQILLELLAVVQLEHRSQRPHHGEYVVAAELWRCGRLVLADQAFQQVQRLPHIHAFQNLGGWLKKEMSVQLIS